MDGDESWDESIVANPYVENVTIYLTITGDNGLPVITSEVTVTISGPSGEFSESYSLSNNEVEYIEFSASEGDVVGEWTLLLESDNLASDFTYDYDWRNYYLSSG